MKRLAGLLAVAGVLATAAPAVAGSGGNPTEGSCGLGKAGAHTAIATAAASLLTIVICYYANAAGSGSALSSAPVATRTAFAIAGATAMIGVSPAPADGPSFRSTMTTLIDGTSLNRGTR